MDKENKSHYKTNGIGTYNLKPYGIYFLVLSSLSHKYTWDLGY